jgi:hypothetical protein
MALGDKIDFGCIEKVLKPVKRIERKGLQDLIYENEEKRIELWNKIEEARDFFEENDSCCADSSLHRDIESRFALARLKLATSLNESGNYPNITKRFNEKEMNLFEVIDEFDFFDILSEEEIKNQISRKEGKAYEITNKYSGKLAGNLDKIIEDREIKMGIRVAIKNIFKDRLKKIDKAIHDYIDMFGIGGTKIFIDQISAEIKKINESEQKRTQISSEVQEKLDNLEDELEEARQAVSMKDELENKLVEMENGIVTIKDGDKISTTGITSEINEEKMEGALIDRRIKALETDAKVTTITQNISKSISSTKIDEDSDEILDMLNKIDEGSLEPEHVKKQLSKNTE